MAEMLSLYIKTIDGLLTKQPIKMQSDQPYLPKKKKKHNDFFCLSNSFSLWFFV